MERYVPLWSWELLEGSNYNKLSMDEERATVSLDYGGYVNLQVTAVTDCGTIVRRIKLTATRYEGSYYSTYSTYPNPSSDSFVITQSAPPDADAKGTQLKKPFEYKLFDKNGNKLKEGKSTDGEEVTVNVKNVPADNYFLHIFDGKDVIKRQILIQH